MNDEKNFSEFREKTTIIDPYMVPNHVIEQEIGIFLN